MYQSEARVSPETSQCLGINKVPVEFRDVDVDLMHPGVWQTRRNFTLAELEELGDSMVTSGGNVTRVVLCPRAQGGYYIISGERRWRAAQLKMIPRLQCIIGAYSHDQARFISAVENVLRVQLNPIEEAQAYADIQETGLSHEQIGKELGKSRSHISNYLRLLTLDIAVKDALIHGKLTATQARPLCSLDAKLLQREIASKAIRLAWSVKRIEDEVSKHLNKPKPKVALPRQDADIDRLTRLISEHTGYPCVIKKTPSGNWQMGFIMTGDDQFVGLIERLGIKVDE
ncbi:TPA: ParB/RepB/Spo0J family partition protein [Pseudomonas aeruginosa]